MSNATFAQALRTLMSFYRFAPNEINQITGNQIDPQLFGETKYKDTIELMKAKTSIPGYKGMYFYQVLQKILTDGGATWSPPFLDMTAWDLSDGVKLGAVNLLADILRDQVKLDAPWALSTIFRLIRAAEESDASPSPQPFEFEKGPGDNVSDEDDYYTADEGTDDDDSPPTSEETAEVSAIQSRALVSPINADFTPAKLQFATKNPLRKNTGDMPGSLYFASGRRIRLIHRGGPEVSLKPFNPMRRYWVTEQGEKKFGEYKNLRYRNDEIEEEFLRLGYLMPVVPGGKSEFPPRAVIALNQKLLEFWDGDIRSDGSLDVHHFAHISRGAPAPPPFLNQNQINQLFTAAHNNIGEREVCRNGIAKLNKELLSKSLSGGGRKKKQGDLKGLTEKLKRLVDKANKEIGIIYETFYQ